MSSNKDQIARDLQQEMEQLAIQREIEEQEKRCQFELQKRQDEKNRVKNELMDQLNKERQFRAREVLIELSQRGIKKVGKDRIIDLEKREEELDYD